MRWLLALVVALVVALAVGGGLLLVLGGGDAERPDLAVPLPAAGGGSSTLAISPVRSVVASTDTDSRIAYTLGNPSRAARTYRISSTELSAQGTPLSDTARSAGRWAVPARTRVIVPPRGSVAVAVRVRPPTDRGSSERRIGISFTDAAPAGGGSVGLATRITTSVYVEGTGPVVRRIRLSALALPRFGSGDLTVRATLTNRGTVLVVPGSAPATVIGTMSGAQAFALAGDVARPDERVSVVGVVRDPPIACWCQVRITATSGDDQVTSVAGHVLILPWWWVLGTTIVLVVAAVLQLRRRRRRHGANGSPAGLEPRAVGGPGRAGRRLERRAVLASAMGAVLVGWPIAAAASASTSNSGAGTINVSATVPAPDGVGTLPDTGGVPVWVLAAGAGLLAGGLVLVASGCTPAKTLPS